MLAVDKLLSAELTLANAALYKSRSETISTQIFVVRHGNVADHQGDVELLPEGKRVAFQVGVNLADRVAAKTSVTVLYAPTTRTRETARELVRGLEIELRAKNKNGARISSPREAQAIRNFHFVIDGASYPPTDQMHSSLPATAQRNPFLNGFWQAAQDPIAYWLTHPSKFAESPSAVAGRLHAFFISRLDGTRDQVDVLVTHSGPMRAYLRNVFGTDPGEPDYCEMFLVNADGVHYRGQRAAMLFRGVERREISEQR